MREIKTFFDHCKLTNVKLYLNSEFYPYDDLKLDFKKRRAAILYDLFICFRTSYYQTSSSIRETSSSVKAF